MPGANAAATYPEEILDRNEEIRKVVESMEGDQGGQTVDGRG